MDFEFDANFKYNINDFQLHKTISGATDPYSLTTSGLYMVSGALHANYPVTGSNAVLQLIITPNTSRSFTLYYAGYMYTKWDMWIGSSYFSPYGWVRSASAPGTLSATTTNSNGATTHTHEIDLIPRKKLDNMQSSAKYVRIARMTKDIGTSGFGAQFFVFGGGSYGGTGINSDIVTISPRGTLGATTVRAKRLDTSASVQNKYYHRVNGDYIELWMYQGTYSYDTTIELKNVSSNNSGFVLTFPYSLIQTSAPSGLVEGTYS